MTPVVHGVYPLDDIAHAHKLMEMSDFFGKIVLSV
ncbi:zinc-binding dehydrogenase [Nocardia sp. NPDC101769]